MAGINTLITSEFSLDEALCYLNHAAVAPWPRRTARTVARFAEENATRGAAAYPEWLEVERSLREKSRQLLNAASADDIALLKNTSEALSVVAHGFPWREGDNVVTSDEEFPSNRIVWQSLDRYGVRLREIPLRGRSDPEQALLDGTDGRTRLLSISSVEYASGLRLDLTRLGAACRRRGIAFCVDAIQGLGAFAYDVEAMRIDFLMADGHKWLLGPEGLALFYCRPAWRERLRLYQYGWHMVEHHLDFDRREWTPAAGARRFECGSPNMLGIHALEASLSLLLEAGLPQIEGRVLEASEYLFERIGASRRLELLTDPRPGRYAGIVVFRHRQRSAEALHQALRRENIICAARGGGIRFSPHFYTPHEHLRRAVELAEGAASES